jgi:hypothetical protein
MVLREERCVERMCLELALSDVQWWDLLSINNVEKSDRRVEGT